MKKNATPPKKKTGRPEEFNQEIADKICELIVGGQTLTKICSAKGMPSRSAVQRWCLKHAEFNQAYWSARKLSATSLADDAIDIIDDNHNDIITDAKGRERTNSEVVNRSRYRAEVRLKLAAKYWPERFGERIEQKIEQKIEQTSRVEFTPLTAAEVAAELSKLLGVAEKELNLPPATDQPIEERVERVKTAGGGVLPPSLYEAMWTYERGYSESIH